MPKLKSHKGLLKRIRITGSGKVRFKNSFTGHLKSHKTGKKLRQLDGVSFVKRGDIKRMERLLHRPVKAADAHE